MEQPKAVDGEVLPGLSKREILEQQPVEVLLSIKHEALNKISDLESLVHLVNDVLDGNGYTRYEGEENEQVPVTA